MKDSLVLTVPVFSMLANEAFRLRRAVFIDEQKVPEEEEFDAEDFTADHVVALGGGEVRGTLRIMLDDEHVKIGRVVVHRSWRGRGVASAMIRYAMEKHRDTRANRFFLTAQSDKLELYRPFGFLAFGEEFFDAGMPHRAMRNY